MLVYIVEELASGAIGHHRVDVLLIRAALLLSHDALMLISWKMRRKKRREKG
jgi:hypothetical protein